MMMASSSRMIWMLRASMRTRMSVKCPGRTRTHRGKTQARERGRLRLRSRIQSDIQGVCDTTENGMAFRGDINTLFNIRTKRM
jgi:hypothetical protein